MSVCTFGFLSLLSNAHFEQHPKSNLQQDETHKEKKKKLLENSVSIALYHSAVFISVHEKVIVTNEHTNIWRKQELLKSVVTYWLLRKTHHTLLLL